MLIQIQFLWLVTHKLLITWNIALKEEQSRRNDNHISIINVTRGTYLTGDALQLISRALVSS